MLIFQSESFKLRVLNLLNVLNAELRELLLVWNENQTNDATQD